MTAPTHRAALRAAVDVEVRLECLEADMAEIVRLLKQIGAVPDGWTP
jgi:hypothetical protein